MRLLHLGDLEVTLPLAAAALAWLLAARAWRAAGAWAVLYAGTIALVGGSKIAYLGWGLEISPLDFKALSGHAAGVTAVYPLVGYLLCRSAGQRVALAAAAAGLVLGAVVTASLVREDEHAVAEAAAGWLLGACASIGTVFQAERGAERPADPTARRQAVQAAQDQASLPAELRAGLPADQASAYPAAPQGVEAGFLSAACALGVFAVAATLMHSAHVGYWMIKLALALSGNATPYPWESC